MNKRLLSIILAMVLSLSLAPTAMMAQEAPSEAEGYIEESVSPEEGSEEAALQETMTEAQSEEQTESSAEAVIPDDTSEVQSESYTESTADPSAVSESESLTESGTAAAGSDVSSPSNESENNIDSEQSPESSVDPTTENGEPASQNEAQEGSSQDASTSSAAAAVQALIDALPEAASIDENNMEDVIAQLEAIDAAKDQLSDDEIASLDFTHYDAAAAVLTRDETGLASTPMLTNNEVTSVSTEVALLNAFANGGSIKLAADITITAAYGATMSSTLSLDLNGYAITGNGITVASGALLTISDSSAAGSGKINSDIYDDGNLVITGGTIQSLTVASSDVCTITGGTIIDDLYNYGTLNAGGGTAKGYVLNGDSGIIQGYGAGMTIFEGNVYNNGTISSGIFYKEIENNGAIIYSVYVTVEFIDSSGTIGTQQVPCGEKANPPTKTGYTATYYMDSGCTKAFDVSSAIKTTASTLNIYVTWTENSNYTVKYNTDGGSTVSDRTGVKWTDKVLNGVTNPTKNGYEFAGWTYSADGATTVVNATTTYADLAKTDTVTGITLTATWTEKDSFTVAFDTDGGSTVSDRTGVKWTDKVLNGVTNPTKNGYEFAGWTYSADGATPVNVTETTTYADLAQKDTATSIELIVKWKDIVDPVISDIENGKTYCAAQLVKVTDDNLAKVTVNGTAVNLNKKNQFTLFPEEGAQTIVATDKAGNEATMTVTVNDGHEWKDATYKWADDNSSCTATRVCKWDQTHVETETATAVATVTQKQSCTNDELTTYMATFKNTAFGEQKKENVKTEDKLDHDFTELRYNETQHWYKCSRCEATDAIADHSGGTATCKDRAICTLCQQPYGSTDSDNHIGTLGEWQSDGTQHWKVYSCCLAKAEIGKHVDDDKNHICDTCGYDKLGEHVDKDKNHICDYGCEILIGECVDEDHDHYCDYGCGKNFGEHVDKDKNHICDYGCETLIGECVDEDHDHLCDYGCGKNFGEHTDANKDHKCDYGCATQIGECIDEDHDHLCDYGCGKSFGAHADANKDHKCDYGCETLIGEHTDADKDHKCDYGCETLIGECVDEDHDHLCDYGCGKSFGAHADANKDHKCDYGCETLIGEHTDANKDHKCDYGCETLIGECVDEDHNHLCDYGCGKSFGEHVDKDKNHQCDYGCETLIGECVDEDHDHYCDYGCGKSFGEHADANKDHKCDYGCTTTIGEHADKNNDHNCDYCGEKLSEHTGGTATCKDKAVCDICGEAYGELAPHSLTHVAAKAATTEAEGNKEYWHCSICDKYFSDEDAANEIKLADTVIAKLEPETTTEAQKNKQDPPKDKPDEKKDMPKTGDDSNMLLWLVLLLLSAGTISTASIVGRKRK